MTPKVSELKSKDLILKYRFASLIDTSNEFKTAICGYPNHKFYIGGLIVSVCVYFIATR